MEVNRFRRLQTPNTKNKRPRCLFQIPKCEKVVGPTLWVSGFGVWRLQMPNTNTQQLLNRENANGIWAQYFGFRGSGFRGLRIPNATNNNSRIAKKKTNGVWARSFSGFGVYKLPMQNTAQRQTPNHEITKKVWGPANIGFRHLVMLDA
jgi:hypothetical protein